MIPILRGAGNTPSFWLCVLLLVALLLFSQSVASQSSTPYVEGKFFVMPVVQVVDTPYRIVWQIVETGPIIDLLLYEHEQLLSADTFRVPSYYGDVLHVPHAMIDGTSFWGEFVIDSEQPVIFRLLAADANNAGATGVRGKWRIIEEVDASACGEGISLSTYYLRVEEVNNSLNIISNQGSFMAELNGLSLQWNGSFPEDQGTTSTEVTLLFGENLDNLSGASQWTWSDGSNSCAGVSFITGELLHN